MLERIGHEVLSVETITTSTQQAVVRTHHTMYAHIALSAPATASPGANIAVDVSLVKWDDRSPITDEDRSVDILVNGVVVNTIATSAGIASVTLTFADAGTYVIEARNEFTQSATVEVNVV